MDEPAPEPGGGLVRLRLTLGYDGTDFHGWARQPGVRTVEETLLASLRTALRLSTTPLGLVVAGRTDAGVHARAQVAHVDVPEAAWAASDGVLVARLKGLLPPDVRVTSAAQAPRGFDARFSALWRRYSYTLGDARGGVDPLRRRDVVALRRRLDVDAMNEASDPLVGEHDYLAYCRPRQGASTVREVRELSWQRGDGLVQGRVVADAFCHHMVRALAGALVAVGEGRRPPSWPGEVLRAAVRDPAVTVMPPHGLVLEEVGYPPDDQVAERARHSRRLRSLTPDGGGPRSGAGAGKPSVEGADSSRHQPDPAVTDLDLEGEEA